MKIETEEVAVNKETLPHVIQRLLAICKTDPNFHLKEKFSFMENKISELEEKVERQEALLIESEEIRKSLSQRSSTLDQSNYDLQTSLLELLGSEL